MIKKTGQRTLACAIGFSCIAVAMFILTLIQTILQNFSAGTLALAGFGIIAAVLGSVMSLLSIRAQRESRTRSIWMLEVPTLLVSFVVIAAFTSTFALGIRQASAHLKSMTPEAPTLVISHPNGETKRLTIDSGRKLVEEIPANGFRRVLCPILGIVVPSYCRA